MMNFIRKHKRKIFVVVIVAFLGGTFMGGGAYLFGPAKDQDAAAAVNKSKIPLKLFSSVYTASADMYRRSAKEPPSQEELEQVKIQTLQALVQEELFYQKAQDYKILVSDAELKNDIQSSAMFRNSRNQFDPNIYYSFLHSIRMSPKEYENLRKKQIAGEKLKILLASSIKISDSEFEAAVAEGFKGSREDMIQIKANEVLNEWFMTIAKSAKIVTNNKIFQ